MARTIVLTKLTGSARSRRELEQALQRKDVPDEVATAVLDRMGEVGLVDDAAFADGWVASRQQRRHLSARSLRQELMTKGVDRDDIDAALEQVGPEQEYAAALALAEKKARSLRGVDRVVRRRRLAGALARRGFGSAVTGRVLAEVEATAGDDDAGPDAEDDGGSGAAADSAAVSPAAVVDPPGMRTYCASRGSANRPEGRRDMRRTGSSDPH